MPAHMLPGDSGSQVGHPVMVSRRKRSEAGHRLNSDASERLAFSFECAWVLFHMH